MENLWGIIIGAVAFVAGMFVNPSSAQAQVTTSPPAPIGTGSGALYTYASQPLDVTILILSLFGFVFFLLFVFTAGAWIASQFKSGRALAFANHTTASQQADYNKNHIESNQAVLQLTSDSNFLRDDSKEQAAKSHELVRDIAKELLNQSNKKDEIDRAAKWAGAVDPQPSKK